MVAKTTKKRTKKQITEGVIYIHASFNNTIVTITEDNGDVITWASSGSSGFKGSRKSTPYSAQVAAEKACEKAKTQSFAKALIRVKGVGPGREQAIRGVNISGIEITGIVDDTPLPHNGCRQPRVRRN